MSTRGDRWTGVAGGSHGELEELRTPADEAMPGNRGPILVQVLLSRTDLPRAVENQTARCP